MQQCILKSRGSKKKELSRGTKNEVENGSYFMRHGPRPQSIEDDQTLQFAGRKLGICCMQAGLQEEASQNGGGEGNFKSPRRVSSRSYPTETLPKIRARQINFFPLFTTIHLQSFLIGERFGDCQCQSWCHLLPIFSTSFYIILEFSTFLTTRDCEIIPALFPLIPSHVFFPANPWGPHNFPSRSLVSRRMHAWWADHVVRVGIKVGRSVKIMWWVHCTGTGAGAIALLAKRVDEVSTKSVVTENRVQFLWSADCSSVALIFWREYGLTEYYWLFSSHLDVMTHGYTSVEEI